MQLEILMPNKLPGQFVLNEEILALIPKHSNKLFIVV